MATDVSLDCPYFRNAIVDMHPSNISTHSQLNWQIHMAIAGQKSSTSATGSHATGAFWSPEVPASGRGAGSWVSQPAWTCRLLVVQRGLGCCHLQLFIWRLQSGILHFPQHVPSRTYGSRSNTGMNLRKFISYAFLAILHAAPSLVACHAVRITIVWALSRGNFSWLWCKENSAADEDPMTFFSLVGRGQGDQIWQNPATIENWTELRD